MKIICGLLLCFCAVSVFGQKNRIIQYPTFPAGQSGFDEQGLNPKGLKAVLEILDIKVDGHPLIIGETFTAGDDWLKSLTIRMKNVSQNTIIGARINFGLPETTTGNKILGFSLEYGQGLTTGIASNEQKTIKPNEEFELKFNEAQYQRYRKSVSDRSGLTDFNKAIIGVTTVKFEDGSTWATRCVSNGNSHTVCR